MIAIIIVFFLIYKLQNEYSAMIDVPYNLADTPIANAVKIENVYCFLELLLTLQYLRYCVLTCWRQC